MEFSRRLITHLNSEESLQQLSQSIPDTQQLKLFSSSLSRTSPYHHLRSAIIGSEMKLAKIN